MKTTQKQGNSPGTWETLRSLQFGITTLVAVAVLAAIGTVIPQGQSYDFYREHYNPLVVLLIQVFRLDDTYSSPIFLGLMGLFGLNLALCTAYRFPGVLKAAFRPNQSPDRERLSRMPIHFALPNTSLEAVEGKFAASGFRLKRTGETHRFGERGRLGYLGATIVHLSLFLFLAGGMVSLATGKRGQITLYPGESTSLAELPNGNKIPLGFTVQLDSFKVAYYEDFPDRPKSFTSSVTITPHEGAPFRRDIRVNHPFMRNGFTIHQSSFGASDDEPASAGDDTARVEIRLKGAGEKMPPIVTTSMALGDVYTIPGFGDSIQVKLTEVHRNFRMGGSGQGSNPAVKLDVLVRGNPRWSLYAFKNFPGMNMPMHPDIDFQFTLLDLQTVKSPGGTARSLQYYTVLGAVRDRGVPLVWGGAVLMMLGLFCSFYIRPRRVWVLEEGDGVHIGAQAKGESNGFREEIARIIGKKQA